MKMRWNKEVFFPPFNRNFMVNIASCLAETWDEMTAVKWSFVLYASLEVSMSFDTCFKRSMSLWTSKPHSYVIHLSLLDWSDNYWSFYTFYVSPWKNWNVLREYLQETMSLSSIDLVDGLWTEKVFESVFVERMQFRDMKCDEKFPIFHRNM